MCYNELCVFMCTVFGKTFYSQKIRRQTNIPDRRMCMNKTINLQDVFLNQCRKDKIMVTIILTNGFQFKGMVRGFDSYVAIFDCDGKQQLVYKHAISTIIPARAVSILDASEKND